MKRPNLRPPTTGDSKVDRALQEVYDNIAALAASAAKPSIQGNQPHTKGDGGELRLIEGDDRKYYLQARFKDGWVTTVKDVMQFQNSAADTAPSFFAGTPGIGGGIPVETFIAWGTILGTLSDQADLQAELDSAFAIAIAL